MLNCPRVEFGNVYKKKVPLISLPLSLYFRFSLFPLSHSHGHRAPLYSCICFFFSWLLIHSGVRVSAACPAVPASFQELKCTSFKCSMPPSPCWTTRPTLSVFDRLMQDLSKSLFGASYVTRTHQFCKKIPETAFHTDKLWNSVGKWLPRYWTHLS